MSDKIVALAVRMTSAPPVAVRQRDYQECGHKAVWLITETRTLTCRDCGMEGLDAFEHLTHMAGDWSRWQWEIKALTKLRKEQEQHERDVWDRRFARHLKAHPDHVLDFKRTGWQRGECEECFRLVSAGRRWKPLDLPR